MYLWNESLPVLRVIRHPACASSDEPPFDPQSLFHRQKLLISKCKKKKKKKKKTLQEGESCFQAEIARYYQIAPPKQKLHSLLYPGHCRHFLYTPFNFLCHDEPLTLDQPQPVGTVWLALRGDVPADL